MLPKLAENPNFLAIKSNFISNNFTSFFFDQFGLKNGLFCQKSNSWAKNGNV